MSDSSPNESDDYCIPDGHSPVASGSSITKGQLFTLVSAFILRHCCTDVAVGDLISLLNSLIPGCLPHNLYFFRKLLHPSISENIQLHGLCYECGAYLCKITKQVVTCTCSECGSLLNCKEIVKKGSTFLMYPIDQQLKMLLEKVGIVDRISQRDKTDTISDIGDGSEYKKLSINFPESLSLTCNTDGIPAFASSNSSLWPIYFVINELPLRLRHVHMMLAALWIGPSKPRMDSYFRPVVECLEQLYDRGIEWMKCGRTVTTKVYMSLVSCDSVARPLLQNMKQFNGEYGCGFCLMSGYVAAKGQGYTRSYAQNDNNLPEERSHHQMLQHAEIAVRSGLPEFGIKGPSIMSLVPNFDVARGFVPDYMHSVLLGVVRQFVFLWCDSTNSDKPFYLGRSLNKVDDALLNAKPPSNIKRLPRSILSRRYWKASEWRNFLLFYSSIFLRFLLPKDYARHWNLLVYSIFQLTITPITLASITSAELALHKFVQMVQQLYGCEYVTYNVHLLTHLPASVERWGPLWSHSAFFFEDANGKLLKYFHGSRGVTDQIFRSFIGASHLLRLANIYIDNSSAVVLEHIINTASLCKNALRVGSDVVCLGYASKRTIRACELVAISQRFHCSLSTTEITEYTRAIICGALLQTFAYCKSTRRRDCYFLCKKCQAYLLLSCVLVNIDIIDNDAEVDCKKLVLLAHPVHTTQLHTFDTEINANLSCHVKKAVVDYNTVVALNSSEFDRKVFILSDSSESLFCIPIPTFELD